MPFTTTFATLSARGFGLFGKQKVLTTVTFPSGTSTWTAPPGVNSLLSVSGKGSDGVSDYYSPTSNIIGAVTVDPGPTASFGTIDWSVPYGQASALVNTGGPRTVSTRYTYWYVGSNNQLSYNGPYYDTGVYTNAGYVYGNVFLTTYRNGYNPAPTSGQILYSYLLQPQAGSGWIINAYGFDYGYPGTDTTGFSLTFPGGTYSGGTGYPAPTTTYTNVAVTPGATYTVVNNGSLTIQYYV